MQEDAQSDQIGAFGAVCRKNDANPVTMLMNRRLEFGALPLFLCSKRALDMVTPIQEVGWLLAGLQEKIMLKLVCHKLLQRKRQLCQEGCCSSRVECGFQKMRSK